MKKRKHLKKRFKIILVIFILMIILLIVGIKTIKTLNYHQTYEYKLLQKNYSIEEINTIKSKFNNSELDELLNEDYIPKLADFVNQKYFIYNNLERYLKYYQDNPTIDLKTIVTLVNVGRDNNYYEHTVATDTSKDTLILNSSYRSYKDQEDTWLARKKAYGIQKADAYAARAGYSEHQTGLAIDINQFNTTEKDFENTQAFTWLQNNASKYGFILRYPEGKENITGYSYESWHY